jgi:hypothetical protein
MKNTSKKVVAFLLAAFVGQCSLSSAFTTINGRQTRKQSTTGLLAFEPHKPNVVLHTSRRNFVNVFTIGTVAGLVGNANVPAAFAATEGSRKSLESVLYTILRVREATEQETRLIQSGKFKDVQRANVKLACRYMLQNYRLADNFNAAATYLEGSKRYQATDAGQAVVQALQTILEYFDSSDIQNLKVGTSNNMAGKEYIVINGLDAARNGIDRFVSFFPAKDVDAIKDLIREENKLNEKEFDPELGTILNLKPSI